MAVADEFASHINQDWFENQDVYWDLQTQYGQVVLVSPDGISSKTLEISLARNALVRDFKALVGARTASTTLLEVAGQVRGLPDETGHETVVVDFGMLRTVNGAGVLPGSGIKIVSLKAFDGAKFDTELLTGHGTCREVRTERVQLRLETDVGEVANLAKQVWLALPDLPADLELRVGQRPPAWTARGPAQPSTGRWDANSTQLIDLTSALAELAGDSTAKGEIPVELVLTSRVPGVLDLTQHAADIAYLARLQVAGRDTVDLDLSCEGAEELRFELPAWVHEIQEVRLEVTASPDEERTLPPVGPEAATVGSGSTAAGELALDAHHAAAARLDAASPLAELTAVRLPLVAGPEGAEVRLALYEGGDSGPVRAVDGATSEPVLLETPAAAPGGDPWVTFRLPLPVPVAEDRWAVVSVSRGTVAWGLGRFDSVEDVVSLRRGPITGPWNELPKVLAGADHIGARIREVGTATRQSPVAPYLVQVSGAASGPPVEVTPTGEATAVIWAAERNVAEESPPEQPPKGLEKKGAEGPFEETGERRLEEEANKREEDRLEELSAGAEAIVSAAGAKEPRPKPREAAKTITLRFTSRVAGSVTLDQIDLVATKKPS